MCVITHSGRWKYEIDIVGGAVRLEETFQNLQSLALADDISPVERKNICEAISGGSFRMKGLRFAFIFLDCFPLVCLFACVLHSSCMLDTQLRSKQRNIRGSSRGRKECSLRINCE